LKLDQLYLKYPAN